jgi:transcriptional regulator GlxA family with amidase domain
MEVGVLVVNGVADLGLAAVREVLTTANSLRAELDCPPPAWQVRAVGIGDGARSASGCHIPTMPFTTLTDQLDLLIMPAVNVLHADALIEMVSSAEHQRALELLAEAGRHGTDLAAGCTATFFLAESGVLDDRTATTSWWLGPAFRRRYPKVELKIDRILCRSGHVTTAGAVLSHLDLALSLVNSRSPALAELVARYMLIGNRHSQLGFLLPDVIARGDPLLAEFERWVREHLSNHFRISNAAHTLGVTERTLQRATAAGLGMSPRDFVNTIRFEQATRLLRDTTLTVEAVAARVGYQNGATLRGLIRRHGVAIADIRATKPSWQLRNSAAAPPHPVAGQANQLATAACHQTNAGGDEPALQRQ